MKRIAMRSPCFFLLSIFVSLFLPGFLQNALSQGWTMTPSYSIHTSSSADGTYIYTSVTVSGTTFGTCPSFPAQIANECHNTRHTPQVYNVIGGVGGWATGTSVYWTSFLSMSNNQQLTAAPGTISVWSSSGLVDCSAVGDIWQTQQQNTQVAQYTHIQHNYSVNPLPNPCWISSFFDAVRNAHAHHAQDVILDNGKGTGGVKPTYGTPVTAMDAGKVVAAPGSYGPAPEGYPACTGAGGHHQGNYVKIQSGSDQYSTIYFHVKPNVSPGQTINQGQVIGNLDNSGCHGGPHLHVARKDPSGNPVNFTLPCTNPTPTQQFFDGVVDDYVPDDL